MRYLSLMLCVSMSVPLCASTPEGKQKLLDEVVRLEKEFGGHLGFMAKNLDSGETIAYNAAERFPTASAIKLPVMAAFFHLADQKELDPGTPVILRKDDKKQGSGILQYLSEGTAVTLIDAVRLMIVLSDNTATNLVLDRLAATHSDRMGKVNDFLAGRGLKNTRILNRLYSLSTKQQTPEAIRYGIGVSTPEDMVKLLEGLHTKTLVEPASCEAMLEILKQQFYSDMIPRFLPKEGCKIFEVANKTGFINETKVDVGLILSDKANIAMAIFVDKHPDHRDIAGNRALLLAAFVSRAIWNHFTGNEGYEQRASFLNKVDWNSFPGGRWAIYRSAASPFPHNSRKSGFKGADGIYYPYHPHYDDNGVVLVVPDGFRETSEGTNLIVHFHGHMNDNLGVLEQYGMPQTLIAKKINSLLVLVQGPYRARDSAGGKMEDDGGFKALIDDVVSTMKSEGIVKSTRLNKLAISAHSGGYRPAAYALERGGLADRVSDVLLFDAFYSQQAYFGNWIARRNGFLRAAYTDHLAKEHIEFERAATQDVRKRLFFTHTSVEHDRVIQEFFGSCLEQLGKEWRMESR